MHVGKRTNEFSCEMGGGKVVVLRVSEDERAMGVITYKSANLQGNALKHKGRLIQLWV